MKREGGESADDICQLLNQACRQWARCSWCKQPSHQILKEAGQSRGHFMVNEIRDPEGTQEASFKALLPLSQIHLHHRLLSALRLGINSPTYGVTRSFLSRF